MLYSIFIPSPTGELLKAASGASGGYSTFQSPPLGNGYSDMFRGQRAPSSTELIQQLVGTVYACADLNAGSVAANPLRLMVRKGGNSKVRFWKTRALNRKSIKKLKTAGYGVDGDTEEIVADDSDPANTHPLLKLLANPTQDPNGIGSYDLRYCTQLYLESVGKAYWWIPNGALGIPSEIWLLRSHMVREVPDYSGRSIIASYQYGRQVIPVDEVIRFRNPDPYQLYLGGYSPALAAIEKIRIARKEDAHIAALLDNMGRPDAMLIPKGDTEGGGIGQDEAMRWRQSVNSEFRRSGRGGIYVSEFPGELEVLGWKPQDIVEIERAKAIKNDIMNCFGVPDALLERNAANLASAKTADYSHAKYAINPRCVRMAEILNEKLVKLFDPSGRTFLVYDNPVPDDEIFELEVTKVGANQGVATMNENRAALGLDPIDGPAGEMRYMPNTMVPVDDAGMPIVPKPPAPAPGTTPPAKKPKKLRRDNSTKVIAAMAGEFAATLRDVVESLAKEKANENPVQPQADVHSRARGADPHRTGDGATAGDVVETSDRTKDLPAGESTTGAARGVLPAERLAGGLGASGENGASGANDDAGTVASSPVTKAGVVQESQIGNIDHNTGLAGPLPQGDELLHVLRRIFSEQCKAITDELSTKDITEADVVNKAFWDRLGKFGLPDRFKGLKDWVKKMADATEAFIESYIIVGGRKILQRIGVAMPAGESGATTFDRVVNPEVAEAARNLALKFSEATNETTSMQLDQALDKLRGELAEGLDVGDTRVELRKRVQEVFEQADVSRAETIARTEASRAVHTGEIIAANKSGVVKAKKWLCSADACDICQELSEDSAEGIPLNKSFGESSYGPIDCPPAHPNCQCSETFVLKNREEIEAFAAGSEGEAQTVNI